MPWDGTVAQIKKGLGDRFETVPGLHVARDRNQVPYEPAKAKKLPMLSIMTGGFTRAGLENPAIGGTGINDPLMGRVWVHDFSVRLWVGLRGDEAAAQATLDDLYPEVVRALEAGKSLGGIATDAAMARGDVGIVRPQAGNPLLMLSCDTAVEVEEAIN